jgi:hypothetical protein
MRTTGRSNITRVTGRSGAPLFIVFLCSPKRKQQQQKTNLDILQFAAISF